MRWIIALFFLAAACAWAATGHPLLAMLNGANFGMWFVIARDWQL